MMLQDAISVMIDEARSGGRVVYMGRDHREVMRQVKTLKPDGLTKLRYTVTDQSADFTTGGRIEFMPANQPYGFRGRILAAAFLGHGTPTEAVVDAQLAAATVYEVV